MRYNTNCFLIFFILPVSCFLLLNSCTFNPNVQGKGSNLLQGFWEEDPLIYRDSLLQYTTHQFRFTCDSFYVKLHTRSKTNYYADSCFNNGNWQEYAKGNYVVSNDTLYLIGTFTKANYKQKLHGCYRIGQYLPVFIIKNKSSGKLELQSLQQHLPVNLRLKEKTNCSPQPL